MTEPRPHRLYQTKALPAESELAFLAYWRILAPDQPLPLCAELGGELLFHATRGWRFDFAWPDQRVAVEMDGGRWRPGGGRHSSDSDREKMNAAAALGWRVLHFSPRQLLQNPADCIAVVVRALEWRE